MSGKQKNDKLQQIVKDILDMGKVVVYDKGTRGFENYMR